MGVEDGGRHGWRTWVALAVSGFALAACASADKLTNSADFTASMPSNESVAADEPIPRGSGVFRIGRPYVVGGRLYVPEENQRYREEGLASWYGPAFHGRFTANGEIFDRTSISAAHPTLPMPSYVRVTNLDNRRSMVVRVNDRGPFHANRVIDLSERAAYLLGFQQTGTARVRVEYLGRAPLEGSNDRQLIATLREGSPAPPPSPVMVASASPFIPGLTGSDPALGAAPLPPERPFDLGQPIYQSPPPASPSPRAAVPRSANAAVDTSLLAWSDSASSVSPLAGYASVDHVSGWAPILGRGLY
jgi:rare lipoprotein A